MHNHTFSPSHLPEVSAIRYKWIDSAKGIAILLVLIGHSSFYNFCKAHAESNPVNYIYNFLFYATASYMPLFYVLSGYTFIKRPGALRKRFSRLLSPYIGWGCLSLLLTWLVLCIPDFSIYNLLRPAFGILYSRFSLYPTGEFAIIPYGAAPLWFLTSLFTSYILFIAILQTKYHSFVIGIYIAATLLLYKLPILLPWSIDMAPVGAIFLYVGHFMKKRNIFSLRLSHRAIASIILLVLYVYACQYNGKINMSLRVFGDHHYLSCFLFIFIGTTGSFLYCILCHILENYKITSIFSFLGNISLTLLCCHSLAYYAVRLFSPLLAIQFFHPTEYLFIIEITSAILFALLLKCTTKWLKRFKRSHHMVNYSKLN